jgi:hypothetical protein
LSCCGGRLWRSLRSFDGAADSDAIAPLCDLRLRGAENQEALKDCLQAWLETDPERVGHAQSVLFRLVYLRARPLSAYA